HGHRPGRGQLLSLRFECIQQATQSGVGKGTTLPLLRHTAAVVALAFSATETWLFSASKDNALIVYDTKRQMIQCEVQTPAPTTCMSLCQAQRRLFTGLQSGRIVVWDISILPIHLMASIPDGAPDPSLSRINDLDYDASSGTLFSASQGTLGVWALKSTNTGCWGRKIGQLQSSNTPTCVAWAGSSREILAGYASGAVVAFDVDRNAASYALQAHQDEVTALLWLDGSRRLITASKDKTLKIWDFPSQNRVTRSEMEPSISVSPHMQMPGSRALAQSSRSSGSGAPTPSASPAPSVGRAGYPVSAPAPAGAQQPPVAPNQALQRPSQQKVSSALARDDSDDDLAGWDR
ncbi:unnamed protein product, partial [Polarella glacialis]